MKKVIFPSFSLATSWEIFCLGPDNPVGSSSQHSETELSTYFGINLTLTFWMIGAAGWQRMNGFQAITYRHQCWEVLRCYECYSVSATAFFSVNCLIFYLLVSHSTTLVLTVPATRIRYCQQAKILEQSNLGNDDKKVISRRIQVCNHLPIPQKIQSRIGHKDYRGSTFQFLPKRVNTFPIFHVQLHNPPKPVIRKLISRRAQSTN